jgi:predicted RNA-binding protein with RPS1 domain
MASKFFFKYVVPKISKNLTTKRNIQDKVVKTIDEGTKEALGSTGKLTEKGKIRASKWKKDKSKEFKGLSYKLDKLVEKKKKNLKETKTLIKAAGATSVAGAGAAGVSLYNKKKKK